MSVDGTSAGGPSAGIAAVLETEALRVLYGNVVAVNDVTFSVAAARSTGLIGPNGAGKTTMIDALTGYVRPTSGTVASRATRSPACRPHRLARRGLIRTFQSVELFDDLTVEENLQVASEPPGLLGDLGRVLSPDRPRAHRGASAGRSSVTELRDVADRYPDRALARPAQAGRRGPRARRPPDAAAARRARRRPGHRRDASRSAGGCARCPSTG